MATVKISSDYNIFRWYRSDWGQYTQPDPIGLEGGNNLYRYGFSSPLMFLDPLGLKVCRCERRLDFKLGAAMVVVPKLWGVLMHEFIQVVPDGANCGGYGGKAWGYQSVGGGKGAVEPEATPEVWAMVKCKAVPCIDEKKLAEDIGADIKAGTGAYVGCHNPLSWNSLPWNSQNCQGWVDHTLSKAAKQPCCGN